MASLRVSRRGEADRGSAPVRRSGDRDTNDPGARTMRTMLSTAVAAMMCLPVGKLTYHLIGFFDARWISGRLAYNRRDGFREGPDLYVPDDVISIRPTSWLDGALNVTPWRFVTLLLEATNILRTRDRRYFGAFNIPGGLIQQGRTIQFGTRVRF